MIQQSVSDWTVNRIVALVIGVVFLLLGILGLLFATTDGYLLGMRVDLMHNIVHLLTGVLGIWAAFGGWARTFNRVFGIIYLLVGILGLIPALYVGDRLLGMMAINGPDNVLHLVVGLIATLVGFFVHDDVTDRDTTPPDRRDSMARL